MNLIVNSDCGLSFQDLNVDEFEEMFKTKAQGPAIDITLQQTKDLSKGPNKISLLDSNRAKTWPSRSEKWARYQRRSAEPFKCNSQPNY